MERYDPLAPSKLSPSRAAALLRELCIEMGFCLAPEDQSRLTEHPPLSVDDLVFAAEGMKPEDHPHLRNGVCARVARFFALTARPKSSPGD
jgi:hypothetical protein